MANVDIQLGYKNAAFFAANPTLILEVGQMIYLEQTGSYKIGDGVSQLSVLSFLGTAASTTLDYLQIVSKDITDSAALTGTTAITLMKSELIPANTFTTGDVIKILSRAIRNTATGLSNSFMYINTNNNLTGATLVGTQSSAASFYGMERSLYIKSATNSQTFNTLASASSSEVTTGLNGASSLNIDWTVNQYVVAAFQNAAVGNSTVMSSIIIQKF